MGGRLIKIKARELRKNMTDSEKMLWKRLRMKQFEGLKFRRQCSIENYIVDFACFERKLIIEIDGGQHAEQVLYDSKRDDWLRKQGFCMLRFWNNEVQQNLEGVLQVILDHLSPHLYPPPQGGRMMLK
ncbi:MAG: hypothetical protein A3G33_05635 [Omnitrophica bacterium RIFCSPLOWO2_12_FULL_44_17]|uniref:DUF559 domain-containing protein n=1 Tax=Candidatus Danuiimicrobium aquiferis TaxID=1801832 RepID=A0A1G1L348_9BACT|nr:MAG: hypothetical protein A3B72_05115 [Omnitrophica bacterium RIFCSPHIGHO2_02_FULL_45_28]OGW99554.1 MAG: hypothetical protein A3G33_05635 [Omnitrophica bacterium RIFCSPLOWO2_12_FULL_44_17]OGX04003.1 MAG: hypothetical protein A3J12_06175 [Omnitrophica bacterium RIFCSPLOWO2_02_FULL_44_11]